MSIIFKHDAQGAFICGDTKTRMTAYAYPASANAQQARKTPRVIAEDMLRRQTRNGFTHEADFDARQWARLES